jgi:hypothetical protein
MSDQRDYLYLAVKKDTVPPGNSVPNWVGLSAGVRLQHHPDRGDAVRRAAAGRLAPDAGVSPQAPQEGT